MNRLSALEETTIKKYVSIKKIIKQETKKSYFFKRELLCCSSTNGCQILDKLVQSKRKHFVQCCVFFGCDVKPNLTTEIIYKTVTEEASERKNNVQFVSARREINCLHMTKGAVILATKPRNLSHNIVRW